MKTNQDVLHPKTASSELNCDSAKLVSLLALAAGAIAMPQTSIADIIYTDLGNSPATVGFGAGSADYQVILSGTAIFKFERRQIATTVATTVANLTTLRNYRTVRAGDFGPATSPPVKVQGLNNLAVPLDFGQPWGLASFYKVAVGVRNDVNGRAPAADYNHKYLSFQFDDSTQANATRYGWVEIGLTINGYNAGGPLVTVYRYGWENTGLQPTMGQTPVPEPSSAAVLALGAMALGARGMRTWRQKRDAASVN